MSEPFIDNLRTVLDAGRALGTPSAPTDSKDIIVVPQGYQAIAAERLIEQYLEKPRRLKAHVHLDDAGSFIRYVNKFKVGVESCIFAKVEPPSFVAVLDYHDNPLVPAWCEHRASYTPTMTPEWSRFMDVDGEHMNQEAFATFLETNQELISVPVGAELLEMVKHLQGHRDMRCNSLVRLDNGRTQLHFEEDIELRGAVGTGTKAGSLLFPASLTAMLAPFTGGPHYPVKFHMRYRVPGRALEFWMDAIDVHLVIQDAVKQIVTRITSETEIEPLMGQAPGQ